MAKKERQRVIKNERGTDKTVKYRMAKRGNACMVCAVLLKLNVAPVISRELILLSEFALFFSFPSKIGRNRCNKCIVS